MLTVMSYFVLGIIEDFLLNQRIEVEQQSINKLSVRLSDALAQRDADALYAQAVAAGNELDGRILVLSMQGIVLVDNYSILNGVSVDLEELREIIGDAQAYSYGYHQIALEADEAQSAQSAWFTFHASAIVADTQRLGLVLVSVPVQDVMDTIWDLRNRVLLFFGIIAAAVTLLSYIISTIVTNPLRRMTRIIERMGYGDFKQRIYTSKRGMGEMNQLARTFNDMSERLDKLNQSRDEFVSNASHELRTPLSSIKLMVQSLMSTDTSDGGISHEFLTDIDAEIDRLNAIISDLLTLVRMEKQNAIDEAAIVDINEITEATIRQLTHLATGRNITINFSSGAFVFVRGNASRLRQMITNLLDNAIKYTQDDGEVTVAVDRRGNLGYITIQDTGVGIPKDALPHIFDRFYRVDKARSRATGGTGLGLAIVHEIAIAHDGHVTVESEYGHGSTFTVELPVI